MKGHGGLNGIAKHWNENMNAVILAAGRGTRMGRYGKSLPKGMLNFDGQPLLRHQIDALHQGGIENIYVVTGYRKECIDLPDVEYFHNPDYATTNMVESLLCARSVLKNDVLVAYADILFTPELVTKMIKQTADIAVAVDESWKVYWKLRYGTTEEDLESLTVSEAGLITSLGQPVSSSENIDYRYIGMIRFNQLGMNMLLDVYDKKKSERSSWLQSGKPFEMGYMTDLLDEMIRMGVQVLPCVTQHGWLEFDTAEDYELACRLKKENRLSSLLDLQKGVSGL